MMMAHWFLTSFKDVRTPEESFGPAKIVISLLHTFTFYYLLDITDLSPNFSRSRVDLWQIASSSFCMIVVISLCGDDFWHNTSLPTLSARILRHVWLTSFWIHDCFWKMMHWFGSQQIFIRMNWPNSGTIRIMGFVASRMLIYFIDTSLGQSSLWFLYPQKLTNWSDDVSEQWNMRLELIWLPEDFPLRGTGADCSPSTWTPPLFPSLSFFVHRNM